MQNIESITRNEHLRRLAASGLIALGALGIAGCTEKKDVPFSTENYPVSVDVGDTMTGIVNSECPDIPLQKVVDSGAQQLAKYNGTTDQVQAGKQIKVPVNMCEVLSKQ